MDAYKAEVLWAFLALIPSLHESKLWNPSTYTKIANLLFPIYDFFFNCSIPLERSYNLRANGSGMV